MSYITFKIDSKKKYEFKSACAGNQNYVKDVLNLMIDNYLKNIDRSKKKKNIGGK